MINIPKTHSKSKKNKLLTKQFKETIALSLLQAN